MYTQSSKGFVKNIFENEFNMDVFKRFIRCIFKEVEESNINTTITSFPQNLSVIFKEIRTIGYYTDCNNEKLAIVVIYLKRNKSLEKSRTAQRNIVKWYLTQKDNKVSSALVAFVQPNELNWRFSLVKVDYNYDENNRLKQFISPVRRWSFLVGKNEKSHTAQSRFVSLLDNKNPPTIKQIEEAFSIEIITEEFFKQYRDLFIKLKIELEKLIKQDNKLQQEFKNKNITTVDFCKKLLGQILFVYFLQKKGWLGVEKKQNWGSGSKNFLRELYEKKYFEYKNFFNDALEPLLYEALRYKRSDDYYDKFNCKIPFLNGGLFDPINDYDWKGIDIKLPNELFLNKNNTKEGDTGDGILDIFDRYNFTVREDDTLEKEVAIDPELLGKIYEKFNAIREDNFNSFNEAIKNKNENKFNKEYGVYYTPREIVHFMCKQSLLYYLKNEFKDKISDETLENFVLYGEELLNIVCSKEETPIREIKSNAEDIDNKLSEILVCDPAVGSGAFLVGLMNEIVKLRTVLSVLKNEKCKNLSDSEDINTYELKRNCIENCLYGVDIDSGAVEIAKLRLWLSLIVDEEDINNIRPLPNLDYKVVVGDSLNFVDIKLDNYKIFEEIEKLKLEYAKEADADKKSNLKKEICGLFNKIQNSNQFEFRIHFSEVFNSKGGFDLILANPPYIQLQKNNGMLADKYKYLNFETFDRKGDIYCLFYEMGIRILKNKGILCYITSNKWLSTEYGEKLRNLFKRHNPLLLINLGGGVFESATVDTCIFVLEKSCKKDFWGCNVRMDDFMNIYTLNKKSVKLNHILNNDVWYIGTEMEYKLIKKIEYNSKLLKENKIKCYRGITTGYNNAFIITKEIKDELLNSNIEEKQLLNQIIKPLVKGKNLKKYNFIFEDIYLINTGYDLDIQNYSRLYDYLQKFKNQLNKREDKGKSWWNLRACKYYSEFEKEKICWNRIANNIVYSYIPAGYYVLDSVFFITGENLKVLLGILNSNVISWWQKRMTTSLGDGNYAAKYIIEKTPLPCIDKGTNKKIADKIKEYVNEILKTDINNDKLKKLDDEINKLVYQLYNLNNEEIKLIEEDLK
ncbi:MAG: hypothetical protein JG776_1965 [Caloramator sp.]|jgi:hypothetical protein|uniref:Eco57I restriction-modification methylase domain-containing protein n=1 Tax=Caloramator sp. TaxID=1871330 RepID=UPI001D33EABC|nr:N-6 DNA methylase [Caloramator sp.]MBZ4664247.1 hypothetical protein [Caloramator sp.]